MFVFDDSDINKLCPKAREVVSILQPTQPESVSNRHNLAPNVGLEKPYPSTGSRKFILLAKMVLGKSPPYNLRSRRSFDSNEQNPERSNVVHSPPSTSQEGQGRNVSHFLSQTAPLLGESYPPTAPQLSPAAVNISTYKAQAAGQSQNLMRPPSNPSIGGPGLYFGAPNFSLPPPISMHGEHTGPVFQPQPPSQEDLTRIVAQVVATMMNMPEINRNNNLVNFNNVNQGNQNVTSCNNAGTASNFSLVEASKILPIFDNEGSLQPLDFLQYLEGSFGASNIDFPKLSLLLNNVFKKSAKLWWDAFSNKFTDYNQFKAAFIEHFWGQNKQLEIKLKLEAGRFTEGEGLLVDHFNYYVALAKHLQPPYTTEQLVSTIARHFPPNVSSVLIGTTGISEALERLRQADYYFNNVPKARGSNFNFKNKDTHPNKNSNTSKGFLNRRDFDNGHSKNISSLQVESEIVSENEESPHTIARV